MDGNLVGAIVSLTQSKNRLENRRSKDDKMSRRMWKIVETNAGKIGMVETEGGRGKRRSGKEMRKKREKKKAKERKNGRSKRDSRRMGNLG